MMMRHMGKIVNLLISNFGPLLGFYVINQIWGFKAGILVSMVLIFVEYFWLKKNNQTIGHFFYFSSSIVLVFGIADLYIQEAHFIKYEACLINLLFAAFFSLSLLKEKSIVQQFAEDQGRTSSETSIDKTFFFKIYTVVWTLYFLIKAFFYLWVSFHSSMNESLIIRMIVGKLSFWIMMFLSVGIPRQIWKLMERFGLFPSQRILNADPQ